MVYLLVLKYGIEYNEAVKCHVQEELPSLTS